MSHKLNADQLRIARLPREFFPAVERLREAADRILDVLPQTWWSANDPKIKLAAELRTALAALDEAMGGSK